MLVCSVGLFTSCGDDDDDNNDKPDVAGTYAGNLGVTIDDSDPITFYFLRRVFCKKHL